MYSTYLSWNSFHEVMETLISQGLLDEIIELDGRKDKTSYVVTEKGEKFLEYLGLALNSF